MIDEKESEKYGDEESLDEKEQREKSRLDKMTIIQSIVYWL